MDNDTSYPSYSHRIKSPDGTAFITIAYSPDNMADIKHIEMNVGKAGSSVAAWSNGFVRMVLHALKQGVPLDVVIAELTDIATDRVVITDGVLCRSGPEALAIVLKHFRVQIQAQKRKKER